MKIISKVFLIGLLGFLFNCSCNKSNFDISLIPAQEEEGEDSEPIEIKPKENE